MYTLSASVAVPGEGHTHDINMCRGLGSLDMAMLILFCSNTTSVVRLTEERCARVLITENNSQLVPVFIPFYVCVFVRASLCMCEHVCQSSHVHVRGQFSEVSQSMSSGHKAWWQEPSTAVPSVWLFMPVYKRLLAQFSIKEEKSYSECVRLKKCVFCMSEN